MKLKLMNVCKDNKSLLLFLLLMFMFRSAVADWNHIPSGSMEPTILVGDRIFVNKMAYDVRLPFSGHSLIKRADPIRGDIVVFESLPADKRLIKRVVGVPGDIAAMENNILYINGQKLAYSNLDPVGREPISKESAVKIENLMGLEHFIKVIPKGGRLSSFKPVLVPENQYLVLGDNRDNSADSRVLGFVPRDEIIGKASDVVMSFNYDNYYLPRSDRFLQPLYSVMR